MFVDATSHVIGQRYQLLGELGSGSMGTVFCARDRLTGRTLALKRVTASPHRWQFASRGNASSSTDLRLALAQEFQTLASLRHPNIISVLDFGFDNVQMPYFTMALLDKPHTIVQAGHNQTLDVKVGLLLQTLQALDYLHRRGVIHRDLKPQNVLVAEGQVKVLDFGLSIIHAQSVEDATDTLVGTIPYMAPELFQTNQGGHGTDLYAFGVIAYEMFAGHLPFRTENIAMTINDILNASPDIAHCGLSDELAAILARLLAKRRSDRYRDAHETINALCEASNYPLPPETLEVRESFLQAAQFVGRDNELVHLVGWLDEAMQGHASAWLIGGESGVGKSRLVDELRTQALVRGTLVLRGQAISEGGSAYQLWRDVLRLLVLYAGLSNEEASVLKPLVPDISDLLLGRDISDALPLDPHATQFRLFKTVTGIFGRLTQSTIIILEDLQWAESGSLALLDHLTQVMVNGKTMPLLVLGNYRDDERPDLPEGLPGMKVFKLSRLTEQGTTELCTSMLGEAGRQPQLVTLLQRETEGNIFFAVEVMRALAEEAGQLERVATMTLPEKVFAGGVREIVQRRLGRIPEGSRPLLRLAAVAGRQLDLGVLRILGPDMNLDNWLNTCANAVVLEAQGERWRFAHDKLRDGMLDKLPDDERTSLYRKVAEAIEIVHSEDPKQVVTLAHLWSATGDANKERYYARLAGEQAVQNNANAEAIAYFRRALTLLEALPDKFERVQEELALLVGLGPPLTAIKGYGVPELGSILDRARELCQQIGETPELASVLYLLINFYGIRGEYQTAREIGEQLLNLGERANDPVLCMLAHHELGWVLITVGELVPSLVHFEHAMAVYNPQQHGHLAFIYGGDSGVGNLVWTSWVLWLLGYPEQALKRCQEALTLAQELNHLFSLAFAQCIAGIFVHHVRRETQIAQKWAEASIAFSTEHGFLFYLAVAIHYRGWALVEQRQFEAGIAQMRQGIAYQAAGTEQGLPTMLATLAEAYGKVGRVEEGLTTVNEALALVEKNSERYYEAEIHRIKGELLWKVGMEADAGACFHKAIEVAQRQKAKSLELRAATSLARLWQDQNKIDEARGLLSTIYGWFTEGFDTADLREAKALLEELV